MERYHLLRQRCHRIYVKNISKKSVHPWRYNIQHRERIEKNFNNNCLRKLLANSSSGQWLITDMFDSSFRNCSTGRFLKRSPIRTADCSSCQVRALAEAIARDSPASKFASLVHTLPRDASPATSTLGTLVIFVKEAPSASLRPEREREQQNTHVFT